MESIKAGHKHVQMIAHRGLSGLEVENTYPAFLAAANRSFYGIECDVRKTKDKKFVTFHDADLKRLGGIEKKVREMTFAELLNVPLKSRFSSGDSYSRICLFEDYLDICKRYHKVAIIELKDRFLIRDITKILKLIEKKEMMHMVKLITFHPIHLKLIRDLNLHIEVQYLVEKYQDSVLFHCQKFHTDVSMYYRNVSKDMIDLFHSLNIKVATWTIDNPVDALMMMDWGVDYITSNILE
ncbi:MAG TPA: glycerophosphodiester phosphodiesterase family protein [Bacilli bacterium]|nr:glycerophosphodiester phosphodiesterase family protein [Bacilli bacterium]